MKKTIYTLGALLTLFSVSTNAQINFQPTVSYYGTGTNTSDLASGDFNGDGFKDIVISNVFNSTYGTFLGSSTGTFTNSFNSAALAFQPYVIAVADFDNDTKLDLAHTDNFSIVRTRGGTGIGTFTAVTNSAFATGNNLIDMITADFNNDGKPDLATANNNGANVTVALCSTTGTFGTSTNFVVGSFPYALTSGDFNNDGNKDIAVAKGTSTTGSVTVLFGDGLGSFGTPVNYVTGLGPRSVKAADFNGDGNLDLAVANYDSNNISILLGSTTGTFATAVNYNVIASPTSLVCADIDGDAKMDLGVANANTVSVLKGSGSGTFSGGVNFSVSGLSTTRLIADDFNNDTKIDLAVNQYNGMAVFLNTSVCTASISVNSGTICSGQSFTFTPSGATSYTYSTGSSVFTPTATGLNYTVTGTTSGGCVGTAISNVSVLTSPTITSVSNSGNNNICSGNSVSLNLSGWSGPTLTSYTWSTGSNASNITVSPTVTTIYSIVVTNTLGCTSSPLSFTQTVLPAPSVTVTSSAPVSLCAGQSATITITGTAPTSFTGNVNNTSPEIPGGAPSLSGFYVITPTVTTYQQIKVNQSGTCTKTFYYNQVVIDCGSVGINDIDVNNTVSIYPNPANEIINVELEMISDNATISIINALGEVMLTDRQAIQHSKFNIQHLVSGVYFVKLESKNGSVIEKFIKQ